MTNYRPTQEGHYWGRWHTPEPGTADNGNQCMGDEWEVHQVFRNDTGNIVPDFRAFVPGVAASQALSSFEWGPAVLAYNPKA